MEHTQTHMFRHAHMLTGEAKKGNGPENCINVNYSAAYVSKVEQSGSNKKILITSTHNVSDRHCCG